MKIFYKNSFIFFILALLASCHETTSPDVCDPQSGRFISGFHYVSGKFFDENGNWNYREWAKYYDSKNRYLPDNSCIPVQREMTLEEKIEDEEDKLYAR